MPMAISAVDTFLEPYGCFYLEKQKLSGKKLSQNSTFKTIEEFAAFFF